jgi:hypothetical protein
MNLFFFVILIYVVLSLYRFFYIVSQVKNKFYHNKPTYNDMSTPENIPAKVTEILTETGNSFQKEGFRHISIFSQMENLNNTDTHYSLWVNDETKDTANIAVIETKNILINSITRTIFIEFISDYGNDREINTNNSGMPAIFKYHKNKTIIKIPGLNDPHKLYKIHNHIVNKLSPKGEKRLPEAGKEMEFMTDGLISELKRQQDFGIYKFDSSSNSFRLTWKGAVIMTFKLIEPFKTIYKKLLENQAKKILNELEFQPTQVSINNG